jgi:ubiquinone/menaquinone biosynthesis C-methylase UbiE
MNHVDTHTGEHEVFDHIWTRAKLFYNEGDIQRCQSFPELWEAVKFQRLAGFLPTGSQRALEVGCGSGGVSLFFHNTRDWDVSLVDLSDEALTFARRNFSAHARKPAARAAFVKADALTLPYGTESFDVVMSFGLLEHFSDIEQPIAEQMRVLKKGGLFWADLVPRRFSVETFSYIPARAKKVIHYTLAGKFRELARATEADFYENSYSLEYYVAMLEKSGGTVKHALGNRPVTSVGRIPVVSNALLNFYKTDLMQKWWKDFDLSNSRFSKWWGAGWWVLAVKK